MDDDGRLQLYTLGRFAICYSGRPLQDTLSKRLRAMLVYLVFNRHDHPREVLADMIMDEFSARPSFRRELCKLRKVAGGCVEITRQTVGLSPKTTCWVDATVLETGIREICRQPVDEMSEVNASQLEYYLGLYKGDFLAGLDGTSVNFELWATMQNQKICNLVIMGMDHIVDYHIYRKQFEQGIVWATRLRYVDPLRCESVRRSMLVLALSGQRSAALRLYLNYQDSLWLEDGIRPCEAATALYQKLCAG